MRELTELRSGLDAAFAGRGHAFLIAGEPGIGKTSLAEEVAAEAARRDALVARGRCWEGDGAPALWPWVQILRSCLRSASPQELARHLGRGAPHVAQVLSEVRDLLPDLPPPPALDAEQARFQLFDAVTTFLRNLSASSPLVLLVDDLHWADAVSLLLLRFLAREVTDVPILAMGTYRDVEITHGHPLGEILPSLRQERSVTRFLLRGFGETEVGRMLHALHGEELPDPLVRTIAAESGGNPFFVAEMFRHLVEEGALDRLAVDTSGTIAQSGALLPESVRQVVGRRLARLSESCRRVLAAASAIGHDFSPDVLRAITGLEETSLLEKVEEATAARVLVAEPRAVGRYSFSHALVRETLYGGLGAIERTRLHASIASALEATYAHDPEPHLAEIAHHLLEALPGGDAGRAVDSAERAAERGERLLAYEEAARFCERALQALSLTEADGRRRCDLLLRFGEMLSYAGDAERSRSSFFEAARLARALSAPRLLARAALGASGSFADTEVLPPAGVPELLEEALRVVPEEERTFRARLMAQLARTLVWTSDDERLLRLARAAIELAAELEDPRERAEVLTAASFVIFGPDTPEECRSLADEIFRLAQEIRDARIEATARFLRAMLFVALGDRAAFERETAAHSRLAAASKQAQPAWGAAANETLRAFIDGRFSEVEALAERMRALGGVSRNAYSTYNANLRSLRWEQDRVEEVIPLATEWSLAMPSDNATRAQLAWAWVETGRGPDARAELERLTAAPLRHSIDWAVAAIWLSEVAMKLRDAARAERLYGELLPHAARCAAAGITLFQGSVSRPLGAVAAFLGRYEEAECHFEEALAMNRRMQSPPWIAWTEHGYAEMLLARDAPGDRARAAELAEEALATARRLGMVRLERKLGELARARMPAEAPEAAPRSGPEPMTQATFHREGEFWTITWGGETARLKDSKGLRYLAHLIAHPGEEFHALEVVRLGQDVAETTAEPVSETFSVRADLGDAGAVLDATAKVEYRRRLGELREELEEARRFNDPGRIDRIEREIEALTRELVGAVGLGGRDRRAAAGSERARVAATRAIRDAIARIRQHHPALAGHLTGAVRTGTFLSYDAPAPLSWKL